VQVDRLADGLWRWTAEHPGWKPADGGADGWEAEVASTFVEAGSEIVLVDPLVPAEGEPAERFWRALDRDVERAGSPPTIVLTAFWHARSARDVASHYPGAPVLAPDAHRPETLERVPVSDWYGADDRLPAGIEARSTPDPAEMILWLPGHRALVVADVLLGRPGGLRLCPEAWLPGDATRADLVRSLTALLALPAERVLTAHGPPVLAEARRVLTATLTGTA
jgi:glyoxylase-like metal-dependent hydrolase (beta-lactamase superfamily II)